MSRQKIKNYKEAFDSEIRRNPLFYSFCRINLQIPIVFKTSFPPNELAEKITTISKTKVDSKNFKET